MIENNYAGGPKNSSKKGELSHRHADDDALARNGGDPSYDITLLQVGRMNVGISCAKVFGT